jgi:tRNA(fMet)-specific endonuclease VapC
MKRSLLDTDMLSFYLKGNPRVKEKCTQYLNQFGRLDYSTITYYEIRRGLLHAGASIRAQSFERLADASQIWPLDRTASMRAAEICADLWGKGTPLEDADILIAAIALSNDLVLVTNNQRHFERIPGLSSENWTA